MADKIEEKALALASKWERRFVTDSESARRRALVEIFTMLVTEQEAHEADKQAFSDAVEDAINATGLNAASRGMIANRFSRFIIKKPDTLAIALKEADSKTTADDREYTAMADALRQALAARSLKIVEASNAPL